MSLFEKEGEKKWRTRRQKWEGKGGVKGNVKKMLGIGKGHKKSEREGKGERKGKKGNKE